MSLLLRLSGGAPPADGGIPWQPAEWLAPEDEDDDGTWIGAVYAAAFVQGLDVQAVAVAEDDEFEDEPEQVGQFTPPLNEFIQVAAEQPEDEEEEPEQGQALAPALNAFILGWSGVEDDDEEAEPEGFAQVFDAAPVAPVLDFIQSWLEADDEEDEAPEALASAPATPGLNNVVAGWTVAEDDEDEDRDEVPAVLAQIIGSVAAATDFVQGLFEVEPGAELGFDDEDVAAQQDQGAPVAALADAGDVSEWLIRARRRGRR